MEVTGFSDKKMEQLNKMPIIEVKVKKSKDGRFLITTTTITDIRSVKYFERVLEGEE